MERKPPESLLRPKKVPQKANWKKSIFFNDGNLFNLGNDLMDNRELKIAKSIAFERILEFMKGYIQILNSRGVKLENIDAIGSAVFRWMDNKKEVSETIKNVTGIDLYILNEKSESLLSLYSIKHTFDISNQNTLAKNEFDDDDVILLVDQGGGSTEISYLYPNHETRFKVDSIDALGTIALSNNFFTLDKSGKTIAPDENTNLISAQFEGVLDLIDLRIANWNNYPELEGQNVIMYAMGSAFSSCLPQQSNFQNHNAKISIKNAWEIVHSIRNKYESEQKEIRSLYKETQQPHKGDRLSDRLSIFYGLPVYLELMALFNCREIHFAGFGLRYGAYIYKYAMSKRFEDISVKIHEDQDEIEFWNKIKDQANIDDFQKYLETYPNGDYTRVAERKIKKILENKS